MFDFIRDSVPEERQCTTYDADGRLGVRFAVQPEVVKMLVEEKGERLVPGWHDGDTHWMTAGAVAERPANPAYLDGTALRDLPMPCVIVIDGVRYDCTDDHAELEFAVSKTYQIVVEAFPMQDATFEVTV